MEDDLDRGLSLFIFNSFLEQKPYRCGCNHGQQRKKIISIGVHVAAVEPVMSRYKRRRNQLQTRKRV